MPCCWTTRPSTVVQGATKVSGPATFARLTCVGYCERRTVTSKQCKARAVLVITRSVKDTATDIARERLELFCGLSDGHAGLHHDTERDERWEATDHKPTTLLRHEDDAED